MTRLLTCWVRKPTRSSGIARLDAAPLQLVANIVVGDRLAPDPDRRGSNDQQDEDERAGRAWSAAMPGASRVRSCTTTVFDQRAMVRRHADMLDADPVRCPALIPA